MPGYDGVPGTDGVDGLPGADGAKGARGHQGKSSFNYVYFQILIITLCITLIQLYKYFPEECNYQNNGSNSSLA